MSDKLKLIIADDEIFICGMLKKLIKFEELGLELTGTANDGITLLDMIKEKRPNIVITDISMPKMDGLEVIKKVLDLDLQCHFIIISGYRQFEYAYNAIKYNVSDYILKPVDERELNKTLKNVCESMRQKVSEKDSRTEFIRTQVVEDTENICKDKSILYQEINARYKTSFVEGRYRFVILKIDFRDLENQVIGDVTSLIKKLKKMVFSELEGECFDIPVLEKHDGVMFIMNYGAEKADQILQFMENLYRDSKFLTNQFRDVELTLCVGKEVSLFCDLYESKLNARYAVWLRMFYGTEKIYFGERDIRIGSSGFEQKIKDVLDKADKSLIAMDEKEMEEAIRELFALPVQVLSSYDFMCRLRKWIEEFSRSCGKYVKDAEAGEKYYRRIMSPLHTAIAYLEYRDILIKQICEILGEVSDCIQGRSTKAVRLALAYMEAHYSDKGLSLEEVAREVGLNPVYFCNLFKKSTGQNYTEYLTGIKVEKAKELLKESNYNINEIAENLGFSDSRYFSKLFKKEVGIKPTDYRKIYG